VKFSGKNVNCSTFYNIKSFVEILNYFISRELKSGRRKVMKTEKGKEELK